MISMEFETNNWIWEGVNSPQLFGLGGIMILAAVLGLSTSYFSGIPIPFQPFYWPDLGILHKKKRGKRPVRVYMDGCFDLMHYGHANALRQAKSLGDVLVVGVVSDEEIVANKGPPVLSMEERVMLFYLARILSSLKHMDGDRTSRNSSGCEQGDADEKTLAEANDSPKSQLSHFLPTSRRIVQFSNGKGPLPGARVVYIDGAFDLFHAGHVEILRSARQLGDFLLVGVHNDQTISQRRGCHPIMHLHERSLSVLACRYVDEVIIGAPWEVSRDMIATFNISLVVHGTVVECNSKSDIDPYATPKSMGIFRTIESPRNTTSMSVARRIIDNYETYEKRNLKKNATEERYYAEKKFVSGD
ncbi:Ethanolamine-phosphate cytidylyltransferase [Ananas comosus]|uniref:ethanolamine-phosphate cytidylyltransferase n=1 Tax=Ananas comosus TaxID=4615 RepID=A0A199UXF4_ANACO|nr:Ethanolamine-phosphate cytidylyltransferase [Ananas comosus]